MGEANTIKGKAEGTRTRGLGAMGTCHTHQQGSGPEQAVSILISSLLIKQELKNYSNGVPFKHKPQGPLLIVQFLSQSQPTYNKAGLSSALAYSHMP